MTDAVEWCTVVWQVVDGTASSGSVGWTTFGVAALTGVMSVIGILIGQKNQARTEIKSVRAALIAEVMTIRRQLLAYGYLDILRQYADELRPTANRPNAETRSFELSTAQCVNKIYQANLGRLGGLSESEATLIVRFHFMLEGFLLATVAGGDLAEGARYHVIQKAVDLLEEIVETADRLAQKPAPWWSPGGHNVDAGKREKEVMPKD